MREGWEYKKLGEVCEIFDSQRKPVTKSNRKIGEYPYYGATGIQDYVDSYIFDGRYLLIGEDGARWGAMENSAYIIEGRSWVNNHVHIIKPNHDAIDTYLKYFLNYSNLDRFISGAIVRKLTQASLKEIPIPLPPLPIQQSIVSELDEINNLLSLKRKELETYDKLAQSLFYEMFGDPVENEKGWEVKKLGDFGTCVAGATPSTSKDEYWTNGTIPWLSSGEVSNGRIFTTDKKITQLGYDSCSTRIIPPHTIVIAMAGQGKTRGTVGVAEISLCTNQSICSIVTNDMINVDFLYYQIKYLYRELRGAANGDGGRGGLNLRIIGNFKIVYPPLPLQQLFATRIEAIEEQKANVKTAIEKLETLLAARMQYWFD